MWDDEADEFGVQELHSGKPNWVKHEKCFLQERKHSSFLTILNIFYPQRKFKLLDISSLPISFLLPGLSWVINVGYNGLLWYNLKTEPPQSVSGIGPVSEKISSLPATDYSNQVETEQADIRDEGAQRASYERSSYPRWWKKKWVCGCEHMQMAWGGAGRQMNRQTELICEMLMTAELRCSEAWRPRWHF